MGGARPVRVGIRWLVVLSAAAVLIGLGLLAQRIGPWIGNPMPPRGPTDPDAGQAARVTRAPAVTDPSSTADSGNVVLMVVLVAVAAVLLAALVLLVRQLLRWNWGRTDRQVPQRLSGTAVGIQAGHRAAPDPSAAVRPFDPRAAADDVIAAWLAVERAAVAAGLGRLPPQTPTEFIEKVCAATNVQESSDADRLLRSYQRARFDPAGLTRESAPAASAAAERICRLLASAAPVGEP